MSRKLLSENIVRREFSKVLLEDKMTQDEVADVVKKTIKNGSIDSELSDAIKKAIKTGEVSKEMDKKIKNLVADCINNLFKTLWFRHNFYEDEIRR